MKRLRTAFLVLAASSPGITSASGNISDEDAARCVRLSMTIEREYDKYIKENNRLIHELSNIRSEEARLSSLNFDLTLLRGRINNCNPRFSDCQTPQWEYTRRVQEHNNRLNNLRRQNDAYNAAVERNQREWQAVQRDNDRYNRQCSGVSISRSVFDRQCSGTKTHFCESFGF